jgi:cytochrome c oxidase subunit IV
MDITVLLFVLAAVAFLLDAFRVNVPAISWTPLGFALLTAALFLV